LRRRAVLYREGPEQIAITNKVLGGYLAEDDSRLLLKENYERGECRDRGDRPQIRGLQDVLNASTFGQTRSL
jgi:hypothetical protein